MRQIITIGDADIIDIEENDTREDFEIIGAQSLDDIVTIVTPDGKVTYNLNPQPEKQFNLAASIICSRDIFGEAIIDMYKKDFS
jgi:Flp pilus assembly secretin CpaC